MKLIEKKVISYTTINLILLVTNIIVFAFQLNNPLNIKWLMVVYFVMAIILVAYFIFIMLRVIIKHNEINKLSVRFKIFDWGSFVLIPVSIFILVFANFLSRGVIVGSSMTPTLNDGNTIIIYKFQYTPEKDDVAVIKYYDSNKDRHEVIIKRIIALPGDKVEFRSIGFVDGVLQGRLYINNVKYENKALKEDGFATLFTIQEYHNMFKHQLPINSNIPHTLILEENYYIALGDNFNNSEDSRRWGAFNISEIGGKMLISVGG